MPADPKAVAVANGPVPKTTRMHPRTYNWLILPLVVLVRLPVMVPLLCIVRAGEMAEVAGDVIGPWLPGFRYNPESRSRF